MSSTAAKLEYLRVQRLGACTRCRLHERRQWIVFGNGNPDASMMLIGEAPGAGENVMGEPFVGKSGTLLDLALKRVGLSRGGVYVTNIVKCNPPGNRDPMEDEIATCSPYLHAQIAMVKPKVIVTLGRFAGALLAQRPEDSMGELYEAEDLVYRQDKTGIVRPIVALYHPAYVLRQQGIGKEIALKKFVLGLRGAAEKLAA